MNKNHLKILTAVILSTVLLGVSTLATDTQIIETKERYLVTYDDNTDVDKKTNEIKGKGVKVIHTFKHVIKGAAITASAKEASAIEKMPGVAAVKLDSIVKGSNTQDPAPSWGLDRTEL